MEIAYPQIFNNREQLPSSVEVVEAYNSALSELFFINHPQLEKDKPESRHQLGQFLAEAKIPDCWIYFPWNGKVIHTVDEDHYFLLRTARNRNLITEEEQLNYRNLKVGVAGLSVGSQILTALTLSGGPKKLSIADFDTIEISNLNRIRAKLLDVGSNKTLVAAREVWELDPFAKLKLWTEGVNTGNLEKFLSECKLFIDCMDNLPLKISARFICQQIKIPVLMVTDVGDSVLLDVERFDLEPDREIFHGLVNQSELADIPKLDYQKWAQLATKIVGRRHLTSKMKQSLEEIGKTIAAVPQLGATATVAGSLVAFAVRKIANQQELPSSRYYLNLESVWNQA